MKVVRNTLDSVLSNIEEVLFFKIFLYQNYLCALGNSLLFTGTYAGGSNTSLGSDFCFACLLVREVGDVRGYPYPVCGKLTGKGVGVHPHPPPPSNSATCSGLTRHHGLDAMFKTPPLEKNPAYAPAGLCTVRVASKKT